VAIPELPDHQLFFSGDRIVSLTLTNSGRAAVIERLEVSYKERPAAYSLKLLKACCSFAPRQSLQLREEPVLNVVLRWARPHLHKHPQRARQCRPDRPSGGRTSQICVRTYHCSIFKDG
jgi:hypothetical protein